MELAPFLNKQKVAKVSKGLIPPPFLISQLLFKLKYKLRVYLSEIKPIDI